MINKQLLQFDIRFSIIPLIHHYVNMRRKNAKQEALYEIGLAISTLL